MSSQTPTPAISRAEAADLLWRKGILHWKLDTCQKDMHKLYYSTTYEKLVFNCSRRIGKSYTLLILAMELCNKKPFSQIKYAAQTKLAVKNIILPTVRSILMDCPPDLRPEWHAHDGVYRFPNGSELHIAGANGSNVDKLRGSAADLAIVDEAAFVDNLEYLVK